jgi:dihydropteroate synthase
MMKPDEFVNDMLGYFSIRIENGQIVVQHHLPDGRASHYVFRGVSAGELYKEIAHEQLISRMEHAAYLGKELFRAESAIREGRSYTQE